MSLQPSSTVEATRQTSNVCPICDAAGEFWFKVDGDWQKPDVARAFDIFKCPEHVVGWVHPMPDRETLGIYYDRSHSYTRPSETRARKAKAPSSLLGRMLEKVAFSFESKRKSRIELALGLKPRGSRVLEIGVGGGTLAKRFIDAGFEYVGVEPDDSAASRQPEFPGTVYAGTGEELPAEVFDRTYDLIVMTHVIEHVSDPSAVIRSALKLLKPDGLMLVEAPNGAARDFQWSRLGWAHLDVPRHLFIWTPESLSSLFARYSFRVQHEHFSGFGRQFVQDWRHASMRMARFYADRSSSGSLKRIGLPYYMALLASFVVSDKRARHDSFALVVSPPGETH